MKAIDKEDYLQEVAQIAPSILDMKNPKSVFADPFQVVLDIFYHSRYTWEVYLQVSRSDTQIILLSGDHCTLFLSSSLFPR